MKYYSRNQSTSGAISRQNDAAKPRTLASHVAGEGVGLATKADLVLGLNRRPRLSMDWTYQSPACSVG